jgi:hypothetical protein
MIAVGGIAGARDWASGGSGAPARPRSVGPSRRGVDIQQSYDRAGDPALIANANVPGDKSRPQWSVCRPPTSNVCESVRGIAPKAGPTSEFLNPGATSAGTVFQATLTTNGQAYYARTGVWLGKVKAASPPTLSGRARFDTAVIARGATWSGGWSQAPVSPDTAAGQAANVDEINIEACQTRRGTHCVNLTAQASSGGFSSKPPVIDNWFTGWFLFAFDHRIATPFLIAEPGYGSPADIPTIKLDETVARSAPLGPIRGPRPPTITVVPHAVVRGDELLIARVRCIVSCTVRLSATDRRHGSDARITLIGTKLIGVSRKELHHGRLTISLQVGAGPEISGHTDFG